MFFDFFSPIPGTLSKSEAILKEPTFFLWAIIFSASLGPTPFNAQSSSEEAVLIAIGNTTSGFFFALDFEENTLFESKTGFSKLGVSFTDAEKLSSTEKSSIAGTGSIGNKRMSVPTPSKNRRSRNAFFSGLFICSPQQF